MAFPKPAYQNSAGRLLAILTALPGGNATIEIVPKLFDMTAKDQEQKQQACLAGLMEIHKLYLEFRQDVLDADISDQQRKVLLSGTASLSQSIYPVNLTNGFRAPTEAEKSLLEVCATIIPQEDALEEDDLTTIRDSIASLRSLIENGKISPSLRKVLLELIRLSEDAIARFNIYGARGVRNAFKAMLAEAAMAYGLASGIGQSEELRQSGIWPAIVKHLKTIDAIASRLLKYKPLIENVSQFLLGGPPP